MMMCLGYMNDAKNPRFAFKGQIHHGMWTSTDGKRRRKDQDTYDALKERTFSESNSYAKVISPI